jgi:peptidoglycan/LPS O-acetylase OafA/YrhL
MKAGIYSYAAYVIHVVIFQYGLNFEAMLLRTVKSTSGRVLVSVAVLFVSWAAVFVVAALSRKYFEGPILALKKKFENAPNEGKLAVMTTGEAA